MPILTLVGANGHVRITKNQGNGFNFWYVVVPKFFKSSITGFAKFEANIDFGGCQWYASRCCSWQHLHHGHLPFLSHQQQQKSQRCFYWRFLSLKKTDIETFWSISLTINLKRKFLYNSKLFRPLWQLLHSLRTNFKRNFLNAQFRLPFRQYSMREGLIWRWSSQSKSIWGYQTTSIFF